jgi:hypothetical protein
MEEFKKPTSLMAGTNIIFSAGSFMYFYRRMEQLSAENLELKKSIAQLSTKLTASTLDETQTTEMLRDMKKELKGMKNGMEKIEEQNVYREVQGIMTALQGQNIDVILPKKEKPKKKKYKYSSSEESSSESEEKPVKKYKNKGKKEMNEDDLIKLMRKN